MVICCCCNVLFYMLLRNLLVLGVFAASGTKVREYSRYHAACCQENLSSSKNLILIFSMGFGS